MFDVFLLQGGVVFMCSEVAEKLMPKFSRLADERQQRIKAVDMGTIEQLQELVRLVGNNEVRSQQPSWMLANGFFI